MIEIEYLECKLSGMSYESDVNVKPNMLYREKHQLVKKLRTQKIKVVEMTMLRLMYGHTRRDKIRNEIFGASCGYLSGKIRKVRLKWF
ncbi:hypothetical protein H5410_000353 [Solanum commersonii]|uniref:Uncharacterized protein n=1 Tax=Solanum commersonii TaxID=4109 RepID=A0A9J6AW11_SOLCO|nr:hypothetical protein H5410_000353 [Solanum commersonii]